MGLDFQSSSTPRSTRASVEDAGQKLADCEVSDGMRTCGLELEKEKTITLMAGGDDAADAARLLLLPQ